MGAEVDSQVAAPAELRTPNLHRANHRSPKSADGRMAAEAEGLQRRPLDEQRQLQNRLDTNRPSHGGAWGNSSCHANQILLFGLLKE